MELEFSQQILKNPQISNFMGNQTVGAALFHADRRTGKQTQVTKVIVSLRNFANVLEKQI